MECSEKLVWSSYNFENLKKLSLCPPNKNVYKMVVDHWDHVAKPIDGLGTFEKVIARIGAISGTEKIHISKRAVIIMCADNGIVEEGISQSGQEVTAIVAGKMGDFQSSVGKMARMIGMDTIPVDIGINCATPISGVLNRKVRLGTRNFMKEPAMTEEETVQAIAAGIDMVRECKEKGYQILATGEMGIGNTTTSSALTAALLGCEARTVTGRGAGLDDARLEKKIKVIESGLEKYDLRGTYAFRTLSCVGGLDIAGLSGVCIGGALYHVPVILDGVISQVSALVAERMVPGTKGFLIASHVGKEPASKMLLDELGLVAVIDAGLALGEGTGAVMMMGLLDMALSVYNSKTTFDDMKIEQYERFQKS